MTRNSFELNEQTLSVVEEIGGHMPGGFFIYQAEVPETLIYANRAVLNIYGCADLDEFKALTGFTFKGMVHPDDYQAISDSIVQQIDTSQDRMDYAVYRIIRKDGAVRWVDDYGHYTETESYGGIYVVFISDITEKVLSQEKQQKALDSMITAMASDYRSVYHVDIDADDAVCYRADPNDPQQPPEGVHFPYLAWIREYGALYVDAEYREGFLHFTDPDAVRAALATRSIIAYRYLASRDGAEYYEMLRMAGVRHPKDRDDHIVHAIGLGFTDIDAEMRDTLATNRALSEALAAAEAANKAKTAFLSSMSHEIRTPMNAIIGLDALALQNGSLPAETREYLEKIGESAHHLLSLINDILDMSRIESGRMSMRREEYSFRSMLEQINAMVMSQCGEKALDSMITAMASDYRSVYHVDIDADDAVCYRADPNDPQQPPEGVHFPYLAWIREYGALYVDAEYREGFLHFTDPDAVRAALATRSIIAYRYLASRDGAEYYEMLRMAGVRHPKDRDDHIVHAIGLGFTDIDAEMRDTLATNRALSEALAAAEAANKAKTAFLSSMSHEIRTPMNAIIGLDALALQNGSLPAETREYLEKIGESAHHLLSLINDILDMSRIESGRMSMRREEYSFRSMLEQINAMVMSQCGEKGLDYECRVIGDVSDWYIGDDMRLKQVLINILSNAIKFTDAPGSVTLTVERIAVFGDHSTMKFCIRDTGIGMDRDFLPKIFDAFSQEDSRRNSKYGSTGLGMAITKNIVEQMNGTISVESEKGVGTAFTVIVTLKNSEHLEPAAQEAGAREKQRVSLKGRRILMAEDVLINAEIMKHILLEREAETDHAENGRAVFEMFAQSPVGYYDAILMDVRMPEMDGLEATAAIRALDRPDAKSIPIVAMTANAFDEDVQRSLQAGMNAHLSKPVEPEHLYQTLEELIWQSEN